YCYGDGVLLDFRDRPPGYGIRAGDVDDALERIGYRLRERDIVLIHTGASAYNDEPRYLRDHCGMTREATLHLIERGVRMVGIDAPTFDPPVWAMFERREFWEAHRVMSDHPYWHVENLCNLDQIGRSHGFTVSLLPVKWVNTTAAPVRAVAIVDDGIG
ncbi:MAG: cyclase family protein, partial [Candidatus Dormibacteraceae bacterium]